MAYQSNNILIMGDFNYHMISETLNIYTNNYADLWLEQTPLPSDENSYTWDPKSNTLLKYLLPLDNRRMRLDRIILKNGANFTFKAIKRFGHVKIPGKWFLYPSDHYGLLVTLKMFSEKFKASYQLDEKEYRLKNVTGFRTIDTIIKLRYFCVICLLLMILVATFLPYLF